MFTIKKLNTNFCFNWLLEAWIGLLLVDILLWVQFTSTTFIQAYNCLCLDILCVDQDFVLYMIVLPEIVPDEWELTLLTIRMKLLYLELWLSVLFCSLSLVFLYGDQELVYDFSIIWILFLYTITNFKSLSLTDLDFD